MRSIIIALLFAAMSACTSTSFAGASVRDLEKRDRARIEEFFDLGPAPELLVASVVIDEDHYWVLTNPSGNKAVVLDVGESLESPPRELGFFNRDKDGDWVRDAREKFEMQGGIWLLERFRDVTKRGQQNANRSKLDWAKATKH